MLEVSQWSHITGGSANDMSCAISYNSHRLTRLDGSGIVDIPPRGSEAFDPELSYWWKDQTTYILNKHKALDCAPFHVREPLEMA
jgi:hypothetical protein